MIIRYNGGKERKTMRNWYKNIMAAGILVLPICVLSVCHGEMLPDVTGVTGARINENPANIAYIIHVSLDGNDVNPGTFQQPLRTINKAADFAGQYQQNNEGTRIIIHPGIYRETVDALINYPVSGSVGAPIIFEPNESGTVKISASEIYSNWQQEDTDIYSHNWAYDWGLWVDPPEGGAQYEYDLFIDNPILRRREMFFADGQLLTQVLSYSELESLENSFYIDEASDSVFVHLTNGVNINDVIIEGAERMYLFRTYRNRSIIVRGLTFEHATNVVFENGGVSFEECEDILFEDNVVRWCNGNGWGFVGTQVVNEGAPSTYYPTERATVRRNISNYNGIAGGKTFLTRNTILEDNETSYNNWRGQRADLSSGWTGTRFYLMHDSIVRRHRSVGNFARGLWFDTDGDNILLEDSYLCNNADGLKFEVCQGPILVRNCEISNNTDFGILFHAPRGITVQDCNIINNGAYQLIVSSSQVTRYLTDWYLERPASYMDVGDIALSGNVVGGSGSQKLIHIPDFAPFKSTFESDYNYWYHLDETDVFAENTAACPGCTPTYYDYSGWKSITAQDANSTFATEAPVPSYCGDLGTRYPPCDITTDCNVNFSDFSEIASNWLADTTEITVTRDYVFEPWQDTTFNSNNYNSNDGGTALGLENWIFNGGGNAKRCSLFQFDLGSIDSTNTDNITEGVFHISANTYGGAGQIHGWRFHRMLVPWSEESTYNQLYGLRSGIEYDATPFNSYVHNGDDDSNHLYMSGFAPAVENWVDGTWPNYGFIIISYAPVGDTFNAVGFRSREFVQYPNRNPLLRVTAEIGATCDDEEAKWAEDLNADCLINMTDIALLAQDWLETTRP